MLVRMRQAVCDFPLSVFFVTADQPNAAVTVFITPHFHRELAVALLEEEVFFRHAGMLYKIECLDEKYQGKLRLAIVFCLSLSKERRSLCGCSASWVACCPQGGAIHRQVSNYRLLNIGN
jgi:hypothetical protein